MDTKEKFIKVKEAIQVNKDPNMEIVNLMTQLAEMQYMPAKEFFTSCLSHEGHTWRMHCLDCLGFNYDFSVEDEAIPKIRKLLLSDPDYSIRMKAAAVLSVRSKWPDPSLKSSMLSEKNQAVLIQVFQAILVLIGIPYLTIRHEISNVKGGEIEPTLDEISRITQEFADSL